MIWTLWLRSSNFQEFLNQGYGGECIAAILLLIMLSPGLRLMYLALRLDRLRSSEGRISYFGGLSTQAILLSPCMLPLQFLNNEELIYPLMLLAALAMIVSSLLGAVDVIVHLRPRRDDE